VDENKGPLGMIGRDVNRREPYQRICRNAHFMTIKVEVYIHEKSLYETGEDVNFFMGELPVWHGCQNKAQIKTRTVA
jgi:hypothetical protein